MSCEPLCHPWQCFEIGLVTLQFETAFIIGAAEGDNLFDAVFVSDANGLPCIPGESLAGVLRHAVAGSRDPASDELCREVFGFQEGDQGSASRLRLSFAHAHGQDNRPVPFRGANMDDDVLSFLAAGVGRDHVRIGAHGAVDGMGKFDELVVPAGARFTFEIWLARNERKVDLAQLVQVLRRAEIRVGGKSRRGLGRISIQGVRAAAFDLSEPKDVDRFARLPTALEKAYASDVLKPLILAKAPESDGSRWVEGKIILKPVGSWMVGGGIPTGAEPPRSKDAPWDRVPLTERRIEWKKKDGKEQGGVVDRKDARPLVPGSSVKGSLRHRTAFHARRLGRQWLGTSVTGKPEFTEEEKELFGDIRSERECAPGRVFISDVQLTEAPKYVAIQHVSLDRFTQAPMDHLLYDEVALGQHELKIDFTILVDGLSSPACNAFHAALDDLCKGRLALGAGRGHGRFKGTVSWSDGGKWMGGRG